ncbi:MAG TPA: HNH endonuclease [Acidobacteriaceae bacterium]
MRKDEMVSLQDIFTGATEKAKDALRFYEENYSSIGQWILQPGEKVILASSKPGVCRFCNLAHPNVSFRKEAHAIPECLGNTSLFTKYECDTCNQFFGDGIETSLGNWSKPQRALSGVRGKRGVPKLKEESSRQWRFEHGSTGIKITQDEADPIAVVNEATKEITLTVHRDPHTPVAVLKAFAKIAISLLPEEELPNFRAAMAWIRNADHQIGLVKTSFFPALYTFVPGNNPLVDSVILLRRRRNTLPVPYVTVVLTYGNEVFQTVLPSPDRDAALSGQKVRFPYFPTPYELDRDLEPAAPIQRERLDLTGRSLVGRETIQTVLRYEPSKRDEAAGDGTDA